MKLYPFIYANTRRHKVARHLSFWVFWYLFRLLGMVEARALNMPLLTNIRISGLDVFLLFPVSIISCYIILYGLIPALLFKRKMMLFFLMVFFFALLCGYSNSFIIENVIQPMRWRPGYKPLPARNWVLASINSSYIFFLTSGSAISIKLAKAWYFQQNRIFELKGLMNTFQENVNALNSKTFLVQLIERTLEKITFKREEVLLSKLKPLIEYTINESSYAGIPLKTEIEAVVNYIELNQRLSVKTPINLELTDEIDGRSKIVPSILINTIECIITKKDFSNISTGIDITITAARQQVVMTISTTADNEQLFIDDQFSLSLAMIEHKLQAFYPKAYDLSLKMDNQKVLLFLKLELGKVVNVGQL
jgi:hypothetical protein